MTTLDRPEYHRAPYVHSVIVITKERDDLLLALAAEQAKVQVLRNQLTERTCEVERLTQQLAIRYV